MADFYNDFSLSLAGLNTIGNVAISGGAATLTGKGNYDDTGRAYIYTQSTYKNCRVIATTKGSQTSMVARFGGQVDSSHYRRPLNGIAAFMWPSNAQEVQLLKYENGVETKLATFSFSLSDTTYYNLDLQVTGDTNVTCIAKFNGTTFYNGTFTFNSSTPSNNYAAVCGRETLNEVTYVDYLQVIELADTTSIYLPQPILFF